MGDLGRGEQIAKEILAAARKRLGARSEPEASVARCARRLRTATRLGVAAICMLAALASQARAAPVDTAQGSVALDPTSQSPRNANYRIEVRLDTDGRTLEGSQTLTWTNIQAQPTSELWVHLYWNAWRNRHSTWMREDRIRGRAEARDKIKEGDWGYLEVDSVTLEDGTDLTGSLSFRSPDDDNEDDRTVLVVALPRPVAPGETVSVQMKWRSKIPRTFARTGFRGDFYFIAHWFPQLGVFQADGWNCHQFHAGTEFYSDYGVYDVSMRVPSGYVLGATGRPLAVTDNGDGTTTHRYRQEDVHGFTWTTSPDYLEVLDHFEHDGLPPVDIRLLLQPEHEAQAARHIAATKAALEHYGLWYGAYPYGHVTVIDPAFGSGAGGMEYPTLFTAGTRLINPEGGGNPEGVTIHEAGHQFWYGLVGNNEFEAAWLDEGLNTFSTARTEREAYRESVHVERFFGPPANDGSGFFALRVKGYGYGDRPYLERLGPYRPDAASDRQDTPSWRYYPGSGRNLTYSKTALWLQTLENWLGWDTLQRALSTFFERWKFRHPTAEDFIAVADEATEQDIRPFFQSVMSSQTFDYGIQSVATFKTQNEGFVEEGDKLVYLPPSEDDDEGDAEGDAGDTEASGPKKTYRSEVVARRYGDGVFPVEVLMVFKDGHEVRVPWTDDARWRLFTQTHTAKLDYAVVDPEGVLALDLRPSNNSRQVKATPGLPAWKWAARWTVWLQDMLAAFALFV